MLAKIVAGCVAAYALSPIDLIPDFIPVLGYLDDLLLVPFGIWVAIRLIPPALMAELRERASAAGAAHVPDSRRDRRRPVASGRRPRRHADLALGLDGADPPSIGR